MSQSTTFLLAPYSSSSSSLPTSSPLSLLPFSLGSSSSPYTSSSAPISQYFIPRPSLSPSTSSASASTEVKGEVVASFRGRRVVGQYISIPTGYKGLILGTPKRPDRGGIEVHSTLEEKQNKILLTPASSAPSVASSSTTAGAEGEIRRSTRSTLPPGVRVKGAGQVALSKPRTRVQRTTTVVKRRFRLDSDDEDEDGDKVDNSNKEKQEEGSRLMRTPSKRARNTNSKGLSTPERPLSHSVEGQSMTPIPEIVIQEATPLKHPLPTPKKRLSRRRASPTPSPVPEYSPSAPSVLRMDIDMEVDGGSKEDQGESYATSTSTPNVDGTEMLEESQNSNASEELIPSPATEDDPPSFDLTPKVQVQIKHEPTSSIAVTPTVGDSKQVEVSLQSTDEYEGEGPVRVLRPIAGFEGFTLYTPDVPLAGFRRDELDLTSVKMGQDQSVKTEIEIEREGTSLGRTSSSATLIDNEEGESQDTKVTTTMTMSVNEEEGGGGEGGKLKKGWWRTGGAGEGGDEFVRGLGEWLGLNEILHKPVYLDDVADIDSDDE